MPVMFYHIVIHSLAFFICYIIIYFLVEFGIKYINTQLSLLNLLKIIFLFYIFVTLPSHHPGV